MKKKLCLIFTFLILFSSVHSDNVNWSTSPEVLSGAGINAAAPQIAVDAHGNAIAAWIENHIVKSRTKLVNNPWSSTVTISGARASSVKIVLDYDGNATAVWVENGAIKTASKNLHGNWSSSTTLSNANAYSPTLSVGSAGDVIAVWLRNGNIETSTRRFGMNWQTKVTVNSTAAANPIVAIGGSGNNIRAVLVWQGISNGTNAVFASKKLISGNWNSAKVISEIEHHAAKPSVAVDANGNTLAIWYAYDNIEKKHVNVVVKSSACSSLSGVWDAVSSLSLPGMCNPEALNALVAFDPAGNAVALWNTSFDGETFSLESAVKSVNGSWSDPVDLVNSNFRVSLADLSVTSSGDALGLYMFYNGSNLAIQSVESDGNGILNHSWSVPVTISQGANNAYPKIAASLSGNVIHSAAVWVNNNGVNNQIIGLTGSKYIVLPKSPRH